MEPKANPTPSLLFRELDYSTLLTFKCMHISFFVCWFALLLAGTTIIGYGATNYSIEQEPCPSS